MMSNSKDKFTFTVAIVPHQHKFTDDRKPIIVKKRFLRKGRSKSLWGERNSTMQKRGFQSLGGDPGLIPGAKYYKCPHCDFSFSKTTDWKTIPRCPTHKCYLVEVN